MRQSGFPINIRELESSVFRQSDSTEMRYTRKQLLGGYLLLLLECSGDAGREFDRFLIALIKISRDRGLNLRLLHEAYVGGPAGIAAFDAHK